MILSRIRYCCKSNEKLIPILFSRHYSFIKIKDDSSVYKLSNIENRDSKISNKLESFLNESLDSLQEYIIKQSPEYTNVNHGRTPNICDVSENDDVDPTQPNFIDLPDSLKSANDRRIEFLDLRNIKDIEYLLSIPEEERFKTAPQISQLMERSGKCNIPKTLNLYIRSLPEVVERNPEMKDIKTQLNLKSIQCILSILLNQQWFKNASYIIYRMNLPFNKLINLLNEMLKEEPIFQRSLWMKYMFLISFFQFFKNNNPMVLSNIDFLNSQLATSRFKILNTLYHIKFSSMAQLQNEMREISAVGFGDDSYVKLMYYYKLVDVIKMNQFNAKTQVKKFISLISKVDEIIPKSESYYASLIPHICAISNEELKYILDANIQDNDVHVFLFERKTPILNYLILDQKTHLKGFDMLSVLQCKPCLEGCTQLWTYHINKMNQQLQGTMHYKFIVNAFIGLTLHTPLYSEIVNVEFTNLSDNKKKSIIHKSLDTYFKKNTMITRNIAGKYISRLSDHHEHSHIMNSVMDLMFWHNNKPEANNMSNLFRFLEVVSSWSPTLYNKRKLFEKANGFIIKNRSSAFQVFEPLERYDRLMQFVELIKSVDSEASKYLMSLQPALIVALNEYINASHLEKHEILKDERVLELGKELCTTFDTASSNSDKMLVGLNPKSYSSKTYLSQQSLLQAISIELNKLPIAVYKKLMELRICDLCNKKNDWILNFNRSIDTFSIFLEVLLRRGLRGNKRELGDLSPQMFREYLRKELKKMSYNNTTWSIVQFVSNYDWDVDIKHAIEIEENNMLGEGIIYVFNALKNMEQIKYKSENRIRSGFSLDGLAATIDNDIGSVTNLMFDSVSDLTNDELVVDADVDVKDPGIESKGLLEQDFLEYNELYQNLKTYRDFIKDKKEIQEEVNLTFQVSQKGAFEIRKKYTSKEKERLLRFYGPVRVKSLMIESIIESNPFFIDKLIVKLFEDYTDLIPISLLHSAMIGIIRSKNPDFDFNDKINVIKVIDVIVSMIYSGGSKRSKSYLFMKHVKYVEYRTALVDLIIKESKRSNSGSLKTLNWAMNKIVNSPNLEGYKKYFNRWTNELNNMKESKVGFWNPSNINNIWDRRKE